MNRRIFVQSLLGFLLLPLTAFAEGWNKRAFEAQKLADAESGLAIANAQQSDEIELIVTDRAENGAVVQVEIVSHIANTESISLFVAHNPTPLIAHFYLANGTLGHVVTRIKMAQTSDVKAFVKAGGQYYFRTKNVVVLEDGCGGSDADSHFVSSMNMRARLEDNVAQVKVIIVHPMTTGRSKNTAGDTLPAHFVQQIKAQLNGQTVLEIQTSTAISKNPYLTFYLANAKAGDQVLVTWVDNQGMTGQGEVQVKI